MAGQSFSFPKAGFYDGQWYEVHLMADVETDYIETGVGEEAVETLTLVRVATILLEKPADELLSHVVQQVIEHDPERLQFWLEPDDDIIEAVLGDEFRVRASTSLMYDTDGNWTAGYSLSLQDMDGVEIWNSQEAAEESDEDTSVPLGVSDLDNLAIAASVLNAPQNVIEYLQTVRTYPELLAQETDSNN